MKYIKQKQGGFTIVEVMIVLAIAGLVIAIVFIAVPALRRSSNNSGRSADVGQLTTAISNYSANRNGQLPNTLGQATHVTGSALGWAYYEFEPAPALVASISSNQGGTVGTAAGFCTPLTAGLTQPDCLDPTRGTPAAAGTWTPPVTAVNDVHRLSYIAAAGGTGITAADAVKKALPSPDEVHVWAGYRCVNSSLPAGNPQALSASANRYLEGSAATDHITKASQRDVAIVYQLEGEATALCIDDI